MLLPTLISALSVLAYASAPAATPAAAKPAPLREVSYKVSIATRNYSAGEHFSGFSTQQNWSSDAGTVTVDITAVQNDALGISLTEIMNKTGNAATFNGSVMPDGTVMFPPESIQDVSRELLQYFGPEFVPADKLVQDASWDVNVNRDGVDVKTNYRVTKIVDTLVTVAERQTIKIAGQNLTISTDGTIVLKPSLLVPISGDLQRTVSRVTVSGDTKTETALHFERVSDSRDLPTK